VTVLLKKKKKWAAGGCRGGSAGKGGGGGEWFTFGSKEERLEIEKESLKNRPPLGLDWGGSGAGREKKKRPSFVRLTKAKKLFRSRKKINGEGN